MSSMRNAVSRRVHRERAQPEARQKWGLLEKHKDYSLRAQDYNLKKKKLAQLSRKVEQRNPDEFAFGMLSKDRGRQGKHGQGSEENRLSHDAVKLLKTQDAGYLRVTLARGRKDMKKVEEELGASGAGSGRKTVFNDEENSNFTVGRKRNADGKPVEHANITDVNGFENELRTDQNEALSSDIDQTKVTLKPKSRKQLLVEHDATSRLRLERKKRKRLQELRTAKLDALRKRQKEIMAAADLLDLQRAKMARTVGGVNKNGIKFKVRERKT